MSSVIVTVGMDRLGCGGGGVDCVCWLSGEVMWRLCVECPGGLVVVFEHVTACCVAEVKGECFGDSETKLL